MDSKDANENFLDHLNSFFKIKKLGALHVYLNLEIVRKDNSFMLRQQKLIEDNIKKHGIKLNIKQQVPLAGNLKLDYQEAEPELSSADHNKYRTLVALLIYLRFTRPDIKIHVHLLSRHLAKPQAHHLKAVYQVWQYLANSKDKFLILTTNDATLQVSFAASDSTWADNSENRRSTSGGAVFIGKSFGWSWSTQQANVATSSAIAEFYALSETVDNILYAREFLRHLGFPQTGPTVIHTDNQAMLELANTNKNFKSTKAIEIRYFSVREQITQGTVSLIYTPSEYNIADFFTKPQVLKQHLVFRKFIGVQDAGGDRTSRATDTANKTLENYYT
jgi:hypothetical protein